MQIMDNSIYRQKLTRLANIYHHGTCAVFTKTYNQARRKLGRLEKGKLIESTDDEERGRLRDRSQIKRKYDSSPEASPKKLKQSLKLPPPPPVF